MLSISVSAAIPQYLNINGRLSNTTDFPQDGRFVLNFSLYTQAGGGSSIWTEIQNISVSRGQFNATLGTNTSLAGVNFDQSLWLGIRVHHPTNNAEMTPRFRMTTTAFAFRANTTFYVNGTAAGSIDMNSYSLFGAGWLNATNINATGWVNATAISIDAGTLFVDAANNRVGIGTISPQFALDVRGSINSTGWVNASDINATGSIYGTIGWTNFTDYPAACPSGQAITTLGDTITCAEAGGGTNVSLNYVYNSTDWIGLRSTSTGVAQMEIGLQIAADLICTDCIGTTEIEDSYLLNTGDTSTGDYTFDTTTFFIDSSNDRIGIGTTSPQSLLHVVGAGNTLNISNGTRSHLFVNGTTGRVGIGTTSPNSTLHVVGDVNITGNLTVNNRSVGVDFQRFTASGTWNKPSGVTVVIMEVVGAGGGGAGGRPGGESGGGGGGAGALVRGIYNAADLPATLNVTIGTGGAGGGASVAGSAGRSSSVNGTDFKNLTAFGGGGGGAVASDAGGGGGGGGGTAGDGATGSGSTGGNGGNPTIQGSSQGNSTGGRGASGASGPGATNPGVAGSSAEFGGGGGGSGGPNLNTGGAGGSSIYGPGAGGGGGGSGGDPNTGKAGGAGGAWASYTAGGGGAGGAGSAGVTGNAGTDGTSRNYGAGNGGGGGSGAVGASSVGGTGGAGGAPGGGGGGGGGTGGAGGAGGVGGAGARGEVRIWAW